MLYDALWWLFSVVVTGLLINFASEALKRKFFGLFKTGNQYIGRIRDKSILSRLEKARDLLKKRATFRIMFAIRLFASSTTSVVIGFVITTASTVMLAVTSLQTGDVMIWDVEAKYFQRYSLLVALFMAGMIVFFAGVRLLNSTRNIIRDAENIDALEKECRSRGLI